MSQTQAKWALIGAANRKKKMDRDRRIERLEADGRMIVLEAQVYRDMLAARTGQHWDVWKWFR